MDQLDFFAKLENPSVDQLLTPDQIYEAEDLELAIRLGEDHRIDRKSARRQSKDFAKELSGFGNGPSHHGGVVLIGVEDDGTITGCTSQGPEKINKLETFSGNSGESARFETKRVQCINIKGEPDFVIFARVFFVPERLVSLSDGSAFKRVGDQTKKLTDEEKNEIKIAKGERSFELETCALKYPDDFHIDRVREFCKRVRENDDVRADISDEQILENKMLGHRVSEGFAPSNTLAIMFAKQPQRIFSGAYIRVLRYEGLTEGTGKSFNVIKDRVIEGTAIDQIKNAADFLSATLREFTHFVNGKFESRPEYPNDAWYELLVNAVAHRSYQYKNAPIFIKLFDDRIEFESPGGFMPLVTPDSIYSMHRPRNRTLMFTLKEFGEVKCMNEGTRRVKEEMEQASLPEPIFEPTSSDNIAVRAILKNDIANRQNSLDSEAYQALGEALSLSLSIDERKIVNFVIENGTINVSEALRIMSTNIWHTAKKALKRLESRGILDFVSTKVRDPNAHYILSKPNK